MAKRTEAQVNQSKHWERSGQIYHTIGLLRYILRKDNPMRLPVRARLTEALNAAEAAWKLERLDNEFINPHHRKNRRHG